MSKNGKLGKKEKKYYRRLLERKCISLGINDTLVDQSTGGKSPFVKKGENGAIVMEGTQPKIFWMEVTYKVNPQRNLIKRLLDSTAEAIEAFLKTEG